MREVGNDVVVFCCLKNAGLQQGAKRAFLMTHKMNARKWYVNVAKNYRPRPTIYNATRAWTTKDAADFEVYRLTKDT